MKKNIAFIIFIICLFSVNSMGMVSVKPEIQKINVIPGENLKCYIEVRNDYPDSVKIEVQPEDWNESNTPTFKPVLWLKAKPEKFTLAPGKTKKVKIKASIPKGSSEYYMTQVFFALKNTSRAPANIGMRIGSLIYWKVNRNN